MAHAIAIPLRRPPQPPVARPAVTSALVWVRRVPWAGLLALALAAFALLGKPDQSSWWLAAQAGLVSTLLFARRFGVPPRSDQDEVLQAVSHDLRAPLAATEGYIKYLMGCEPGTLNEEQLDLLNTALANLNRLEHFVNDTLDLARLDAGRMDYRLETLDAAAAVEQVLTLFRFSAQERGVRLENRLPRQLPAVRADPEKLERVLTNLVSNALKFTDRGGRVSMQASWTSGELILSVTDTGIGMPPEALVRLFQRFSRPQLGPDRPRGAGLGLWIVKGLVEGHGGRIWVESSPGVGSRFHFSLLLAGH